MSDLSALLQPFRLRHLELRNRVMMTAHVTNFAHEGLPSEQHVAYYAERSKGGIALIVMGFPSVHPTSQNNVAEIRGYDPAVVPGLERIATAVHEHGAKIIAQLGHAGRQSTSAYTGLPLLAPSAIPCPFSREMPKEMEPEDIEEIVAGHATVARHVNAAGLDGVEIHSGYGGYLLSSFLSPYMNFRKDEYGGPLENRARIVLRVIEAVRAVVGDDFVVGIQINGDDFSPGGITPPDAQEIAKLLVGTGSLDYVTVKGSTYYSADQNIPDMQHPRALWVPLAATIKDVLPSFPVFTVGRIASPQLAAEIIERGCADMVAMTRQHISDPETVRKIQEGRSEDVRGCVACNQGCLDQLFRGTHVTCIHNPAAGHERELGIGTLRRAERAKSVLVVGAGPAGMKAAETAARRGHSVTLLEQRDRLGGQVRLAAAIGGREELGEVVSYLERQLAKLPVDVQVGRGVKAGDVVALAPDAVVVATGSRPTRELIGLRSYGIHSVEGLEGDRVLDVWDVVEAGKAPGQSVLVVDDGEGHWKGLSLALELAGGGRQVSYATPLPFAGAGVSPFSIGRVVKRLQEAGVRQLPFTLVTAVEPDAVRVIREGKPQSIDGVESVVLAGWHKPVDDLYFELKGRVPSVVRIGDAVASRTILSAVHEAERAARAL